MTSYITITDAETDPEAPLTSELAKKWRDNPIAIAEGDSTAPTLLLPTAFLGSVNTTSGTTQTLSGLVLTPYKYLYVGLSGVSFATGTSITITVGGAFVFGASVAATSTVSGFVFLDLTGSGRSLAIAGSGGSVVSADQHTLTTASTSISVTCTGSTFDAGIVRFYGAK